MNLFPRNNLFFNSCLASGMMLAIAPSGFSSDTTAWRISDANRIKLAVPVAELNSPALAETKSGMLIAAWAGGSKEYQDDFSIWASRWDGHAWEVGQRVTDGIQSDGKDIPCGSPSIQATPDGTLYLSFSVGAASDRLRRVLASKDEGKTWALTESAELPTLNDEVGRVALNQGTFLEAKALPSPKIVPDKNPLSSNVRGLPLVVNSSKDGQEWSQILTLEDKPTRWGCSQPAALQTRDGAVHFLYVSNLWQLKHVVLRSDTPSGPVLVKEFIETEPVCAEVHASSLAEVKPGMFSAAWFAGTKEGNADTVIMAARRTNEGWTASRKIAAANGPDGKRVPSYNPVLFLAQNGRLALVYSAGWENKPWLPWLQLSDDTGETWSKPIRLPDGMRGPDRNPPLRIGEKILHPSTADGGVHVEISDADLSDWQRFPKLEDPDNLDALQPVFLDHGNGRIQMLCRTFKRQLGSAWSEDGGKIWGPLRSLGITMANSGIDAVRLPDGRFLLVYNPTGTPSSSTDWGLRYPITIALSDDGINWRNVLELESTPIREGYAYPCVIVGSDGKIHLTYTWGRKRIRYVVVDPALLEVPPQSNNNPTLP